MPIIQYVMPSRNKALKKLLHFYWEVCPKYDENGKLKQEMILVVWVMHEFVIVDWVDPYTSVMPFVMTLWVAVVATSIPMFWLVLLYSNIQTNISGGLLFDSFKRYPKTWSFLNPSFPPAAHVLNIVIPTSERMLSSLYTPFIANSSISYQMPQNWFILSLPLNPTRLANGMHLYSYPIVLCPRLWNTSYKYPIRPRPWTNCYRWLLSKWSGWTVRQILSTE